MTLNSSGLCTHHFTVEQAGLSDGRRHRRAESPGLTGLGSGLPAPTENSHGTEINPFIYLCFSILFKTTTTITLIGLKSLPIPQTRPGLGIVNEEMPLGGGLIREVMGPALTQGTGACSV